MMVSRKAEADLADEPGAFRITPDEDLRYGAVPDRTAPGIPAAPVRVRRRTGPRFAPARVARSIARAAEREAALGTPFLFVPVALVSGAVVYFQLDREPAPWNLVLGLTVLAGLSVLTRQKAAPLRWATVLAAVFLTGMALAQFHTWRMSTPMLGSAVTTRLTGRIVAIEERANGRTRYTIDVMATERPRLRYAPDRIRATAAGPPDGLSVGEGIHGVVRLTPPSGPFHPGGYDFALHAFFDGYGANGFFLGDPAPRAVAENASFGQEVGLLFEKMRQRIGAEIRRVADGRGGAVSVTLITGNKSVIPEDVTEALRITGLAHILSISGLHMALVAATVMSVLRLGFAFAPGWSARHPVRKYAAAGALAATGFYLFLAGAGVATQRSFIMLSIMLLALTFDRNAVTMRNLALAALGVVAIAPHEATGPGFQMSFAATAALIAVYAGWQDHRRSRLQSRTAAHRDHGPLRVVASKAGLFVAGLAVTSVVAGLATGIFASYHFGRVAPYGLVANLAAMPVVSLLVMPLAVVSVIAMPFGLHEWPLRAMAGSVELVISIAERVASLSPALATGQMPGAALACFAAGLTLLCLFSTRLRWSGVPLFVTGIALWSAGQSPATVISEDGRQLAVVETGAAGTRLHVNRARPNGFTVEQWTAAYASTDTLTPGDSDLVRCEGGTCSAGIGGPDGMFLGYVVNPGRGANDPQAHRLWAEIQADACKSFDIVVFADAPSWQFCPNGRPVISARALALRGSVEISLPDGQTEPQIRHALPGPDRPWLDHRRFSRAARNLPEWSRRKRQ